MPTSVSTRQVWHFGIYEVDAGRVELRRNGNPVKLREQSFLVLIHLLEHAGELVTREELSRALWPSDTFVDFDHSLSTAVMKLRDALGDSTGTPVYIETIPKHGYRFIAKVTVVEKNSTAVVEEKPEAVPLSAPVAARPRTRERVWQLVAGLATVLLLSSAVWIAVNLGNDPAPPTMVRFQIPAPDKLMFLPWATTAISPDGQSIAFTAGNLIDANDRLFVRPLNGVTTTEIPVPGIDVHNPFWSPDGRQIAFTSYGVVRRVDVSGGPPVTICGDCKAWLGGTWNRDGVILFSSISKANDVLSRISAAGGKAKPLRPLAPGETTQAWPQFLPDGEHYLYLSLGSVPYQQGIYAASLDSDDRTFIVATSTNATYLQSGQLLFTRGDVLMAQPFDLRALKLSGEPRRVADHIEVMDTNGTRVFAHATFAASPNGVIVWRQAVNTTQSSLQWFDRTGKKLDTVGEPAEYNGFALSPDDSKLAVSIRDPNPATKPANIWIFDLRRGTSTRLTFAAAIDHFPTWSPDGTRIAFTSDRSGQQSIYWKPTDGSQPEQLLLGGTGQWNVEDWSRDDKYLVYNTGGSMVAPILTFCPSPTASLCPSSTETSLPTIAKSPPTADGSPTCLESLDFPRS
jgi:DNA-binding winged helix-turn-helix (wHTH) protein/dipeptidyl aminopeptidase/acylaminoacyl peptidase